MSQQWRQNTQGFRIKFKNQGPLGSIITLLAILAGAALLLFVGVWLFFILLTLGVLLLPWLWWKKRKFLKQMQQAESYYRSQQQSASDGSSQGRVFEGEIVKTEVIEVKRTPE